MANVALFWDPFKGFEDQCNTDTFVYTGQRKRKCMDKYFESDTNFYLFRKHSTFGWWFVGKAVVDLCVRHREKSVTPIWHLRFVDTDDTIRSIIDIYHQSVSAFPTYLSKEDLFCILEFESLSNQWCTGIIPFTKQTF